MPNKTTAADIMTKKLHTLSPTDNVMDAVAMLLKNKVSGAPVVDKGRLVGILSELDCVNHVGHCAMTNSPPLDVGDLMTKEIVTVPPDTTLLTLAHIFTTKRFRRLPVVDEQGQLLGQLSRRDLMKALFEIMKVQQSSKSKPLYLSAVVDSSDVPARLIN